MSSPLAKNLLREFVNWRPRTGTERCSKCKHEYSRHSMFPIFTNIFWKLSHIDELTDEDLHNNMNNSSSNFTFCIENCNCQGYKDE
jgi:hypothetical protein